MGRQKKMTDDAAITGVITEETSPVTTVQPDISDARKEVKEYISEHEAAQKYYDEMQAEKIHQQSINSLLFEMIDDMVCLLRLSEVENDV